MRRAVVGVLEVVHVGFFRAGVDDQLGQLAGELVGVDHGDRLDDPDHDRHDHDEGHAGHEGRQRKRSAGDAGVRRDKPPIQAADITAAVEPPVPTTAAAMMPVATAAATAMLTPMAPAILSAVRAKSAVFSIE